jgi:hypothetical protein
MAGARPEIYYIILTLLLLIPELVEKRVKRTVRSGLLTPNLVKTVNYIIIFGVCICMCVRYW